MNDNLKIDIKKKQKKQKNNFSTSEVFVLVILSFIIGGVVGKLFNGVFTKDKVTKTNDKYINEFIKNYEYVINNYYDQIDKEELINNAIGGMMNSLDDPYSVYLDEAESSNFNITLDGSYKGLGVQITKEEDTGYMLITSVFKNSPSDKAGLVAGDKIIAINGEEAKDLTASDFSSKVRNNDEKSFALKILRNDEEIEIEVVKELVVLDSIKSEIYNIDNKKIGYIYIGIFANNTYIQFKEALEKLEKDNIDGLIIDVRSNTGGHLTAVDDILDLFLSSKQILYQFEKNSKITKRYGTGKNTKQYKIVLLGNEMSASASEVLISGLRENLNSSFVGKKTYGKGTVQELVNLTNGNQYKITVKKWLTPKGNWINDTKGIEPDIEVDLNEDYIKSGNSEDDNQLKTALDLFKNE